MSNQHQDNESLPTQNLFSCSLDLQCSKNPQNETSKKNVFLGIKLITTHAVNMILKKQMKIKHLAKYIQEEIAQIYAECSQTLSLLTIQKRLYDIMLVLRAIEVVREENRIYRVLVPNLNLQQTYRSKYAAKNISNKKKNIEYLKSKLAVLKLIKNNLNTLVQRNMDRQNNQLLDENTIKIPLATMMIAMTSEKPKNCIYDLSETYSGIFKKPVTENKIIISNCVKFHSNMDALTNLINFSDPQQ